MEGLSKTVRSQGWRSRAYREVFTACFGKAFHPNSILGAELLSVAYVTLLYQLTAEKGIHE